MISRTPKQDAIQLKNGKMLEDDDRYPFRFMFIHDRDDVITKVLVNCFTALKNVFPDEWNNPTKNILWKTTGFCGVIFSLRSLLTRGYREHDMTLEYFTKCFNAFKLYLQRKNIELNSTSFPGGGEQNQKKLAKMIVESVANMDVEDYQLHLYETRDLDEFILRIGSDDVYTIYEIACALEKGMTPNDIMEVESDAGNMRIVSYAADACLVVSDQQKADYLLQLKKKYMMGMGVDEWYEYMTAH